MAKNRAKFLQDIEISYLNIKKPLKTLIFSGFFVYLHIKIFCALMKGRNSELIKKRNMALMKRYYYWTETQRLRFDDTIRVLSEREFFISEERVMAIIRNMSKTVREMKALPKVKKPRITVRELELFQEAQ